MPGRISSSRGSSSRPRRVAAECGNSKASALRARTEGLEERYPYGEPPDAEKGAIMNRSERASQIWAVLAWAARSRQSITYAQLGKLIGVPAAGLGQLLEPIQSYCLTQRLPPLTVLVVQQDSGLPGPGFSGVTASEFAKAQAEVFATDWLEHGNPQPEKLEIAVQERPSSATRGV